MKRLLYILLITATVSACAPRAASVVDKPASANVLNQQEEQEQHELLIMDNGFRTWFATYAKPITYHSPSYYASSNRQYVTEWNQKVNEQGQYWGDYPFTERINYNYGTDYGVELNYELYWYFRYIEATYGRRYDFGFNAARY